MKKCGLLSKCEITSVDSSATLNMKEKKNMTPVRCNQFLAIYSFRSAESFLTKYVWPAIMIVVKFRMGKKPKEKNKHNCENCIACQNIFLFSILIWFGLTHSFQTKS